ncbi:hypothetical protein [Paenibacillus eucommiae]|uniref:Lipoprotein n=1 Tax=Paenibacillus eucommiae TaxID=1355755 RepID=A0ABS4J252_9BACL|nr:hypothetical protein [Paenibacillus eucommiae]MBP1993924.1 hypothetical protein [Paenibacillus eucommiae]
MKRTFAFGLLLLFMISIVVACNQRDILRKQNLNQNSNHGLDQSLIQKLNQSLNFHISKPEGQSYKVYKKIEDSETVKIVRDALLNVPWNNAKVSMSRQPDYKIDMINNDPAISYEPVTFDVWLSPKKDVLQVIIEGQSRHGSILKKDFENIFSILSE